MTIQFPSKTPAEKVVLTFDFSAALGIATITSVASVTVTALNGLDPSPMAILNGAATFNTTQALQPVQGGVSGEQYAIDVLVNTNNVDLVLELDAVLPVGFSALCGVSYNDANFRAQFPAFASLTAYPYAALQFAWNMGAEYVNQCQQACWGLKATKLQAAADLMGAIIVYQLYGPVTAASAPGQSVSQQGQAPGPIMSASEGSVAASFQIPNPGSSAFRSLLYASPPYGRLLLSLLQIAAGPSPYIPSGRPAWIPP